MVPAAQRLPQQPGDAGGAEPKGVSPPGAGSSSETGDKCPAPSTAKGYNISSHKAEAPAGSSGSPRGAREEAGRTAEEHAGAALLPSFPRGRGGGAGGGEAGGRARSPVPAAGPPPDCGERVWAGASAAAAAAAAAENPSVLRRWKELCTLGIRMTSSPNERSRLSGKRSRRETRAEPCVATRVGEEKRRQWSGFPASLAKREPRAGGGEGEELMIVLNFPSFPMVLKSPPLISR
ncbi:homeobox protein Hox-D9-like [Cebus imitator]|uniref:homeobox protein Hox-D9-like n=1 Tax=Cebus imitator TaxID=2715852 RepID=UPI00189AE451|nr:homeobox protein Hox-D9-like [Cebus imitator]